MLLLEPDGAERVMRLWRRLAAAGLPTLDSRWQPHITLAAFDSPTPEKVTAALSAASRNVDSFTLQFETLGSFPGRGVLYSAPTPDARLLNLQKRVYDSLQGAAQFGEPYYAPGRWTPHCSFTLSASPRELGQALALLARDWQPFTAGVRGLNLVRSADAYPAGPSTDVLYRSFRRKGFSC